MKNRSPLKSDLASIYPSPALPRNVCHANRKMRHIVFIGINYARIVIRRHMHGSAILHIIELIQFYQTPFDLFYATHKNFAIDF